MKTQLNMFLIVLSLVFITCSSDDSNTEQNLKSSLLGTWKEVSPCESCSTIVIDGNDSIMLNYSFDPETYKMIYKLRDSTMDVTRLWEVGDNKKMNTVKITFKTKDTLLLDQFYAVDTGTTGFLDIVFKKIE